MIEILERKQELGSGSYGVIYLCDVKINGEVIKNVVVKEIHLSKKIKQEDIEREIEILKRVQHNAHTVKFYGIIYEENVKISIVMERLEEVDLYEDVGFSQKIEIATQLLEGLSFIHKQGVVHSDIKPENIMIRSDSGKLVFTDFGLSCVNQLDSLDPNTRCKAAGSLAYVHPVIYFTLKKKYEVVGNKKHRTNFITDLYSLGTVLFVVFMGEKYLNFEYLVPEKMSDFKNHYQLQMERFEMEYNAYPELIGVMKELLNPLGRKNEAVYYLEKIKSVDM